MTTETRKGPYRTDREQPDTRPAEELSDDERERLSGVAEEAKEAEHREPEPEPERPAEPFAGTVCATCDRPYLEPDGSYPHSGHGFKPRSNRQPFGEPVVVTSSAPEPVAAPDAFYGVLGRLVTSVQGYTEANPMVILGALLTYFGALAGEGHAIYQGGLQAPRLFMATVGPTSAGRKGTALDLAEEIFDLVAPGEVREHSNSGSASGEGLILDLQRRTTAPKDKATGAPDPTFTPDPRVIVNEPEFARFLRAMSWKGSTLSANFCKAWDGKPLEHITASKGVLRATSHHVGAVVAITREGLRKDLTDDDAKSGFANRFLWLWSPESPVVIPFTDPASQLVDMADVAALQEAFDWARARRDGAGGSASGRFMVEWKWSDEAKALYGASYRQRSDTYGMRQAITQRADPYVARLALVYAMTDRRKDDDRPLLIEADHLKAAEAFWSYCRESVAAIFGDSTGNRHADVILRELKSAEGGSMSMMEVREATRLGLAADIEEAVEVLVGIGLAERWTKPRADGTKGKPQRGIKYTGAASKDGSE